MANFYDTATWEAKLKMRFTTMDFNKDGVVDNTDMEHYVTKVSEYSGRPKDDFYPAVKGLWEVFITKPEGVSVDEFVQNARAFVQQPDAKDRLTAYANMTFDLINTGESPQGLTYAECEKYGRAFGLPDEVIKIMFEKLDLNKDGFVDHQENIDATIAFLFTA